MNDDATLLRLYAEKRFEAAFTELVRRHVDLVYGAAMRRTGGDTHRAADVAQQVFTTLAREARKLSRHAILPAWLHTATRNAALNLMISEQRRKVRESEAVALEASIACGEPAPEWERIRPLLDGAIDELPEADRAAVVLRFLERRGFAEVGVALKVSADAARMRTERAMEKLRAALARRGVTSSAAALGIVVANQPLMSAPAAVVSALSSASLANAGGGVVATLTSLMSTKVIATAIISGVLAFGIGSQFGRSGHIKAAPQPAVDDAQSRLIASLRQSNASLQSDVDRLNASNAQLAGNVAQLTASNAELSAAKVAPSAVPAKNLSIGMTPRELKQGIMNNLRQINAARDQFQLEKGAPPGSVEELVGDSNYIRRINTVGGEDYSGLSMAAGQSLTVTAPDGTTVTYDPSGTNTTQITEPPSAQEHAQELMQKIGPAVATALEAYRAANQGQNPPNEQALTPFFANPQDATAFAEAEAAQRAAQPH
jgi:RNA polymerase sigma factor (sigma-70 family)